MTAVLEADVFAASMLGVIFCALGVVGFLIWTMRRRAAKRDPYVDALLEEMAEERKKKVATGHGEKPSPPWVKEAGWWKGDDAEPRD
jgi:hypothetical protein